MNTVSNAGNVGQLSVSRANDDKGKDQQHSSRPSGTRPKDHDSNAGTIDFKNTITSMIVGQEVWAVLTQTSSDDDPTLAFLVGVFSTKEKAVARVKQLVRHHPPRGLVSEEEEEEKAGEDLVVAGGLVQAFIKDHWTKVRDMFGELRGLGYQYDGYAGEDAHWVDNMPVQ